MAPALRNGGASFFTSQACSLPSKAKCQVLSAAFSHPVIIRSTTTLRRNPCDDLVGVLNVTGLTVHAVGGIQADAPAVGRGRVVQHLVDVGRTEILAGAAELFHATLTADLRIADDQMC